MISQVGSVPTAAGIDLDALFQATNAFDQGDEESLAMIRRLYTKAAEDNATVQRGVVGVAKSDHSNPRASPTGQTFHAAIGWESVVAEARVVVSDDGGAPVNMISASTAALWEQHGWAHRCSASTLEPPSYDLRGAGGQSLGYEYDLETELYPIGVTGDPSPRPFRVRLHHGP